MSGCFFHLSSNLRKHVQRAGLQERYMNDLEFGLQLRMIAALTFAPPQDMVNFFDELCVVIRNQYDGDADEVLDYFEDTCISCFRRKAPRRSPLFPIELWNMFHRTAEGFHKQIIISRLGITVSKQMFHPLIQRSGSF